MKMLFVNPVLIMLHVHDTGKFMMSPQSTGDFRVVNEHISSILYDCQLVDISA